MGSCEGEDVMKSTQILLLFLLIAFNAEDEPPFDADR